MDPVEIIKRDGTKEPFDPTKIARVMGAAGLDSEQTKQMIDQISIRFRKTDKTLYESREIRDMILEILPDIDKNSANLFAWYQDTKE